MPIYEYTCSDCGTRFEKIRVYKDADEALTCESCQSKKTRRIISTFNSKIAGNSPQNSSSSGCAGCTGGHCSTCH